MLMPWIAVYLLELALYLSPVWIWRRWLTLPLITLTAISSLGLGFRLVLPLQVALVVLTAFRLVNLYRVKKSRMHTLYLWRTTTRTALFLAGFHVVTLWIYIYATNLLNQRDLLVILCVIQMVVALALLVITLRNITKLRFIMPQQRLPDGDLPTVTIAIPARNETNDLHECLDSILANDYPKFEVIVLDETPHSKTAEIIRGYAHDGVRFVRGSEPGKHWLAKNLAYQKLYQEASGDLILFCGVDVRFGKRTIRALVNLQQAKKKSMISVLPLRDRSTAAAAFIQPMRYWWELALPRRLFNRPPVLSTCWLIDSDQLKKLGGFGAISHSIIPEGYFARELIKNDGYSFVRAGRELDVRTVKNMHEQIQTTIRVRYPQLRRRLEYVLLLSAVELVGLLLPFALLISSIWLHLGILNILLAITCSVLVFNHILILGVTDPANVTLGIINFPVVVIVELILGYTSMIRYEFYSVEWKQRNIVEPVMHVIPHLPKI